MIVMSLLLDALRKADQERQNRERAPGIDAIYETPPANSFRWGWWLAGILFCVMLVLLLGLWRLSVSQTAEYQPAEIPIDDVAEGVEALPEKVTPVTAAGVDAEPQVNPEASPEAQFNRIYKVASDVGEAAASQSGEEASQTPSGEPSTAAIAQLYQQDTDEPLTAPAEEKDARQSGRQTPVVDALRQSGVGNIRDLPLSVQNRIPSLMYAAHEYLEGDRPSVVLNGQRWHEGQTLQGGLRIERIERDGVIISLDNHRFKLDALSSWVNM